MLLKNEVRILVPGVASERFDFNLFGIQAMIYLDNAATSFPKAPGVGEAMARFVGEQAANPGRAGHYMAVAAEKMVEDLRFKLTQLFGGEDFHRLIFTLNGTDALNMGINGVLRKDGSEHVVTTALEHNSVNRPLQALADMKLIELTRVDFDQGGFIDPDDIRVRIQPNTKLIVLTHASNVLGTIQDVKAVGAIAREHDVLFLLDAAQTAGLVPISIDQMKIDLLAFPGHKSLLGPTGTGGLYVGDRCPPLPNQQSSLASGDVFRAWREGGTGGDSSSPTQPTQYPFYLEGGTPNTVGIAGLAASVDFLASQHSANVLRSEQVMIATIINQCDGDKRFTVYGSSDVSRHVGTVSINITGYDSADACSILDDSFAIAVRSGLHCAPYVHRRMGTFPGGALRISLGHFNDQHDVEKVLTALDEIAG